MIRKQVEDCFVMEDVRMPPPDFILLMLDKIEELEARIKVLE